MNHFDAFQADAMTQYQRRPDVHAVDVAASQHYGEKTEFTPIELRQLEAQRRYQARHDAEQAARAEKGLPHD